MNIYFSNNHGGTLEKIYHSQVLEVIQLASGHTVRSSGKKERKGKEKEKEVGKRKR